MVVDDGGLCGGEDGQFRRTRTRRRWWKRGGGSEGNGVGSGMWRKGDASRAGS